MTSKTFGVALTCARNDVLSLIKSNAVELMDLGLEPKSAIKQAASDLGVAYGDEMGQVVELVLSSLSDDL